MQNASMQRAFKYVAAVAIAASCGGLAARPRLLELPELLACELVEAVFTGEGWPRDDRRRVQHLLADDPRASVRVRVAEAALSLASAGSMEVTGVLQKLADDRASRVRAGAARALEALLTQLDPFARVELVCQWASAESIGQREALALALRSPVATLVTDLVLEQLSRDDVATVRLAALRAIEQRFDESPASYAALLEERALDPSRRVRRTARRLLVKLAGSATFA